MSRVLTPERDESALNFEIFDEVVADKTCNAGSNVLLFDQIVTPIKENWLGEKLSVYRYFESIVRFFGSLPCAICNSENHGFVEVEDDRFKVFISPLNCLDEVYTLQLALRMISFLSKVTSFLEDLLCLLNGTI